MANFLTSMRIICGLLILPVPAFSKGYYVLYLIGGFTDAADGFAARRLGTETPFGAKFDTVADFVFAAAVMGKLVSSVELPAWLLLWGGVIFAVKLLNLGIGLIRYRQLVAVHSRSNKVCGAVVFLLPLLLGGAYAWQAKEIVVIFACMIASVAAIEEGVKVIQGKAV